MQDRGQRKVRERRVSRTNDDDNDVRAEGPALFRDTPHNTAAS